MTDAYLFGPGREDPGEPALVAEVKARVERAGRITFAEFMEAALYHPAYGYYSGPREKFGPTGDFFTSPETHPVFGALLARQLEEMWRRLGSPRPFTVVEVGAGRGALARDILAYSPFLGSSFYESLEYRLVEVSPSLRAVQAEALSPWADRVAWIESMGELPPASIVGCLLANELLDAFPVHLVIRRGRRLREVYVAWKGDGFVEEVGDPSTPELARYFERMGVRPPEGCRAEVNLAARRWTDEVARALVRGYGLVIDYGYPAAELYSSRHPRGTLMCHYRHTINENPYRRLGRQDISAHVDFTSLDLQAREAGLEVRGPITQRELLLNLGLGAYREALSAQGLPLADQHANQAAMEDLANPSGLGGFLVLALFKGTPDTWLSGLSSGGPLDLGADLPVPLLPRPAPEGPDFSELWADVQWEKEPGLS